MRTVQTTRDTVELFGGPEDGLELELARGALEVRVPSPLGVRAVYRPEPATGRFVFVGYLPAD